MFPLKPIKSDFWEWCPGISIFSALPGVILIYSQSWKSVSRQMPKGRKKQKSEEKKKYKHVSMFLKDTIFLSFHEERE